MPSQTFFNLSKAKRQKIIDLAIAEFANSDYDSASISHVVKQAKIAKGSFYQYFADKKDLYLYLVDLAIQQKIDFLKASEPPQTDMNFFANLRWLFDVGTQFDLSQPAFSQLINRATYSDVPFRQEILQKTQLASSLYLDGLIRQGIEQGHLNADIDPNLAVFVVNTLSNGLRYFIPQQLGLSAAALADGIPADLDLGAISKIFDDLIHVLEHGIGRSP